MWRPAREKLTRPVGQLLLMEGVGGDMGHTYVVYGVGYPSKDYFSVYDPLTGGYRNRQFSEIRASRIYVGWAK